ncbi:MAG TPA: lipoprotein-releasing ABC transporter permease subunit [Vicinamibacterales bacterium]|nr:lipoprotein-releasing ABC transporter permease subunit [Vicinamibacterales bacterium]
MDLPFELFIALRYLLARRKQAFISLISFISTLGVAVGVMALILALALMTGLQGELRNRIVGAAAHVYVWKVGAGGIADPEQDTKRVRAQPRVIGAAPVMIGKALIDSGRERAFITLKGIDPKLEATVTDVGRAMLQGSLAALEPRSEDRPDGIVIGRDLANQLSASVGDDVSVMTPEGTLSPMGMIPRLRRFRVVGIFSVGLYEFDSAYGYVTMDVAGRLLDRENPDYIEARVDDMYAAPAIADDIERRLGEGYVTQDWADMNRSLFSALWLEKMAISITIGLIVMVAALNIIASLVLLVMEKNRDIAILKTMGTSAGSIRTIFMLQGLVIGLVGTVVGTVGGLGVAFVLDHYQVIRVPVDVYQISHVPFVVQPLDLAVVVVAAVLICFVATIYPSRQAARLDPAQALRYS